MSARTAATGLAVNRLLFGIGFLVAPERSARTWIGRDAGTPGARIMVRAAGARDLALALGALTALRAGGDARPWFAAHLVSDASDFAATWRERERLTTPAAAYALAMAGASTGIAAVYL